VLVLLALALTVVAIQQRALELPVFSVRLGRVQFTGPCPTPTPSCDDANGFYAVWRGDDQPDGSVLFHELFF
jgi:hypothetical protein